MQTEHALLLRDCEARLGNADLMRDGRQVLLPVVAISSMHSPSKRKPNFSIKLEVFIPSEGCPSADNLTWLLPGNPDCRLEDIQVALVFQPQTLVESESQPVKVSR